MSNKAKLKELHSLITAVNPKYNIFNNITPVSELQRNVSEDSPLLTYAIKDNISTKEHPLSCSSRILERYVPNYDSTLSKLLKKQPNWVNLGKLNLDEFGMGSGGVHSSTGAVVNPVYDPITLETDLSGPLSKETRVTGGSSSGCAAVCAAKSPFKSDIIPFERLAHFSVGTDTGGSVRLPAAWCNILSFKPTYGRISRYGVVPYANSLDTVGILSCDLEIIKQAYQVLDKFDEKDPTCLSEEVRNKIKKKLAFESDSGITSVGLVKEFNIPGIPNKTKEVYFNFLEKIMKMKDSFEIKEVSIKNIDNSLPIYFTLAPAEAASNLSRFDGLRYGADNTVEQSKEDSVFANSRRLFGEEVQKRILLGNHNLLSELYENKYKKAQLLRTELIKAFNTVLKDEHPLYPMIGVESEEKVDVLISLTSADTAPLLSDFLKANSDSPLDEFCNDIFTIPMSLTGVPVVSVPITGTGISVQISGQFGYDEKVLLIAKKIHDLLL